MVRRIVKFFTKKEKINDVQGFADIKPYIFNQVSEVKRKIKSEGINLFTFMLLKFSFRIKNYLGIHGKNINNMWKFIDDLILIETINENSINIQEIYHRVKEEAIDILNIKIKRGKLFNRLTEYVFFAILICIFFYFYNLVIPLGSYEHIVIYFIFATMVFYFVPFFLMSYRNRNYPKMLYYLKKESEEIDKIKSNNLFDQDTTILIGVLNKSKKFKFSPLPELYVFLFEKKDKNWDKSRYTIRQCVSTVTSYEEKRDAVFKRLILIKSSCNYFYKNYNHNNKEKHFFKTNAKAKLISHEFKNSILKTKYEENDFTNILALFISKHTFESKVSLNLSLYLTEKELFNIVSTIDDVLKSFKKSITKKALSLYPNLTKY
ncbi:MAG: hypothetical protein KOO66_02385 [Bacteroidales bacterium]|nr:hypothetical protein [Bacteroidales bacterium]